MRQVSSKIYDKDYYLNTCLGSELFKNSGGKLLNDEWISLLKLIKIKKGLKILDLGCGRGDVSFYLARQGAIVTGIDYSLDAIELANEALIKMPSAIKQSVSFLRQDAKKIHFQEDYFDIIVCFDVFEHLYKEELEIVMGNISKILKKNGTLLVHTEVNKLYLDYLHKWFAYPLSNCLVTFNNYITRSDYQSLPKDPRNDFHRKQHVNEPTIFYLNSLFKNHKFKGTIIQNIGIVKPEISWKDKIYNLIVCLHPFSKFFPLNILFATDYVCIMKNNK
jgi:ubiquinone/menaquinone biosynthesis C-methylase UbiE